MPLNLNAIRQKKSELDIRAASFGGPFWNPPQGRSLIRVLPPWRPDLDVFYYEFYSHWVQTAGRGSLCLSFHATPEIRATAQQQNRPICYLCAVQATFKGLKARSRFLVNVVDLNAPQTGVQIWNVGPMIMGDMMGYILDADWGDFTDPQKGFDVIVTREGVGRDSDYQFKLRRQASQIADPTWMTKLNQLDHVLVLDSFEEQQGLLASRAGLAAPPQPVAPLQPATSLQPSGLLQAAAAQSPKRLPPCFTHYLTPNPGYACAGCVDAFDCEAESPMQKGVATVPAPQPAPQPVPQFVPQPVYVAPIPPPTITYGPPPVGAIPPPRVG